MFCTQCGAQASDHARFCTGCGASLETGAKRDSSADEHYDFFDTPAASPARDDDNLPWKRWAVPLSIAAAGYFALYLAYGNNIEQGAQKVLDENGYESVRVDRAYYDLLAPFNGGHNEITLLLDVDGADQRVDVNVYGNPVWSGEYYVEITGAEMMRLSLGM